MPTAFESATLNLRLYELRREPVLREARAWFLAEFHPQTFEDAVAIVRGPRNPWFRMVTGYWDMAASLVTSGAIDAGSFLAAHGEIIGAFSLLEPFLAQFRTMRSAPDYLWHMEQVVTGMPDAVTQIAGRRERLRAMAAPRA